MADIFSQDPNFGADTPLTEIRSPLHDGALDIQIGVNREVRGKLLSDEEREGLIRAARIGYEDLKALTPGQSIHSTGIEHEWTIIDGETGLPAKLGIEIKHEVDALLKERPGLIPGGLTNEYAQFDIESDLAPQISFGPNFLRVIHDQYVAHYRAISSAAQAHGGRITSAGILPSVFPEHLTSEWITPKDRYFDLEASLMDFEKRHPWLRIIKVETARRGDFEIRILPDGLHFLGPRRNVSLKREQGEMVRYNALDTSQQLHWGVRDQADYVRDHRIAELITPILAGCCANSPIVLGNLTGLKENRVFVYSAMLHPRRVFLEREWLRHPLGQLEAALRVIPILEPARGGKESHLPLTPIRALFEHHKTTWPLNRTVFSVDEMTGTRVLRIEHRPIAAGPTILDNVAAAALFYGLMSGMPAYLESIGVKFDEETAPQQLDQRLPYAAMRDNLMSASVDGLHARIRWFDNTSITIHDLLSNHLLPVAIQGLKRFDVPDEDIYRYLGVIRRRLDTKLLDLDSPGTTPSDIIRALFRASVKDERTTCQLISKRLADMLEQSAQTDIDIIQWYNQQPSALGK